MNPPTVEELKQLLDSGVWPISRDGVINTVQLTASDGRVVDCEIYHGWDLVKARMCDKQWGLFNVELFQFIDAQNYDEATLEEVLASIQVDDEHWEWMLKSLCYKQQGYEWFFAMTEDGPQAACLIYHPKQSIFVPQDIFYIEYIAVAPWNRKNPMRQRTFRGVGSLLIKSIMDFARGSLNLTPGFSLHAIPRAVEFYESIGMVAHPPNDKGVLKFYEMAEKQAHYFRGAA